MRSTKTIGCLLLAACGTSPPATPVDLLAPPPEGEGVQLAVATSVEPGEEVERCAYFTVPPEGMWVARTEVRYTGGGHHVILWQTALDEAPAVAGADEAGVFDCSAGPFVWGGESIVSGAQSADDEDLVSLPDGVALALEPGTVLLLDVHLLNAEPEPIATEARINLWTVPPEDVRVEAGILFQYDLFIHVPAGGRASAHMACPVPREVTLTSSFLHLHRHGLGARADLVLPDGTRDEIQEIVGWSDVATARHEPALVLPAGSTIEQACDYENLDPEDVFQGPTVDDEMCVLVGLYWPRDRTFELCAADDEEPAPFLGADWIGDGTLDCNATLDCVTNGPEESFAGNASVCLQDACPEVAGPLSDALRCLATRNPFSCTAPLEACADATCDRRSE